MFVDWNNLIGVNQKRKWGGNGERDRLEEVCTSKLYLGVIQQ